MILEKFDENRESLMQIGVEAVEKGRKYGLKPPVQLEDNEVNAQEYIEGGIEVATPLGIKR